MSFRDDADAARARADALSRELADKDAELDRLRAELARREEKEAEEDEDEEEERETDAAESKLRALRERNATHRQVREQREARQRQEADDEASRERDRRRLASVSVVGDIDPVDVAPLVLIPTVLGMMYTAIHWGGIPAVLVPLSGVCLLYGLRYLGRERARRLYRDEERWARSLPFVVEGYPELLDRKPGSITGSILRLDDPSDHRFIQVNLEFQGGRLPARLDEIMSGFDPELEVGSAECDRRVHRMFHKLRDVEPEARPEVFHRTSPVTTTRSKGGSTHVDDHNRAVRDWIHRLVDECLQPLHAKHRLVRVVVRLR